MHRYCAEVWNASLPKHLRDPRGLSLGAIAKGVNNFLIKVNAGGLQIKSKGVAVNGPIEALYFTLKRAGWSLYKPFEFLDKNGRKLHLPTVSPQHQPLETAIPGNFLRPGGDPQTKIEAEKSASGAEKSAAPLSSKSGGEDIAYWPNTVTEKNAH